MGQRNWHTANSFNLDWSQFGDGGGSVKAAYAGIDWDGRALERKLAAASEDLRVLAKPRQAVKPGKYRVYLAPAAMQELMAILSWGGFGLRARMTRVSPLLRLYEGEAALAPSVDLAEDTAGGTAPQFDRSGFPRPDRIPLVTAGTAAACLVSPRSAVEFGLSTNGADEGEAPSSLDLAAGKLDAERAAEEVHRGLLVSNLWYLNFSDRPACRVTGMTRYATTWVENGRVQGPVDPMRFDDSVYRVLGSNLLGLTRQRDWIMDPDTYEWRSLRTARLPGALVEDFTLTL
jgi:predicted Zn-dependent protease